jgi:hypothetical protein
LFLNLYSSNLFRRIIAKKNASIIIYMGVSDSPEQFLHLITHSWNRELAASQGISHIYHQEVFVKLELSADSFNFLDWRVPFPIFIGLSSKTELLVGHKSSVSYH